LTSLILNNDADATLLTNELTRIGITKLPFQKADRGWDWGSLTVRHTMLLLEDFDVGIIDKRKKPKKKKGALQTATPSNLQSTKAEDLKIVMKLLRCSFNLMDCNRHDLIAREVRGARAGEWTRASN
jgi:hypothetical protein